MTVMGPHPVDTGPLEYSANDDYDPGLIAARERFKDQDIYRVGSVYLAVPGDADVYAASTIEVLTEKLRARNT